METWVVWVADGGPASPSHPNTWCSQPAFGIHNASLAAGNWFLCSSRIRAFFCAEFEDKTCLRVSPAGPSSVLLPRSYLFDL